MPDLSDVGQYIEDALTEMLEAARQVKPKRKAKAKAGAGSGDGATEAS